ncbi:putative HTH-type transcriptional regulator YybR [Labrenzia sp. THAF191b]|uniref:winged helix-turn-helix transcriptional regulator n=1 Tax=unclassified Labrenzia TaxID=2648686 RepID=UPI001268EA06|nr:MULTISPECIES: helix-turn-helix domain-containing protein [unclassified Labrenzia]QFS99322.1 putative HTH-type transcriptional regulator YybR [Labrenzia sp. THAF191b]QFT05636.1 putative HTH-type transcriptional regulator YybR [Labrenzia sp. THAF191a]QFT17180.1 putative HTH-type transcriptional regulator YybR [Labrenzia sp. THAF187b]
MSDTAEITPKCVLNSGAPLSELMQQGELLNQNCPSREILRHLTSRWGVLVLIALLDKDQRFSELRRTVGGVSEKMLAQTLQTLEADGFVNRYSHPVVPPHVDYSLSPIGREAAEKVREFADWIEINIARILSAKSGHEEAVAAE